MGQSRTSVSEKGSETDAVPTVSPLGNRVHPLGKVSRHVPIAVLEEFTDYFDAGDLRFGLEYRELNEKILQDNFGSDPEKLAAVMAMHVESGLPDDTGLSLHVFEREQGREMLRFDMFSEDPHYHYLPPAGDYHIIVVYDVATCGNMFTWTMNAVSDRLEPLLVNAGYPELAKRYDRAAVGAALEQVQARATELRVSVPGGPQGSVE